jgi:hypothetical protein
LSLGNEEQQQPHMKEVPIVNALEDPKELEKQLFLMAIKSMF